jgi:hypothetical protein
MLASVPLIPKFASEVTAMVRELRNRDTSVGTHTLNEKNSDDGFEPRRELDQPVGGLPVLTAN